MQWAVLGLELLVTGPNAQFVLGSCNLSQGKPIYEPLTCPHLSLGLLLRRPWQLIMAILATSCLYLMCRTVTSKFTPSFLAESPICHQVPGVSTTRTKSHCHSVQMPMLLVNMLFYQIWLVQIVVFLQSLLTTLYEVPVTDSNTSLPFTSSLVMSENTFQSIRGLFHKNHDIQLAWPWLLVS